MAGPQESAPARAWVFGGGGVLGFAWIIGALTAVQHELEITPRYDDLMIGTSAGAVVTGLLASGIRVDSVRRHQLGMPSAQDPPIPWNYDSDSGPSVPPRPGWRPGSPRLVWGGLRHPTAVPPLVTLSGLLPAGRGTLEPVGQMMGGIGQSLPDQDGWRSRHAWIVATDYASGQRVVFGRADAPPASLADAVCASCAIPAWYAPIRIGGRAYIDGGTVSNASVDLVPSEPFAEVFVLAPMASLEPDSPRSPIALVERRIRRSVTRGIMRDVNRLRSTGVKVTVLTPNTEDLTAMGANLMNPRHRVTVLRTAMTTVAADLRSQRRRESRETAKA